MFMDGVGSVFKVFFDDDDDEPPTPLLVLYWIISFVVERTNRIRIESSMFIDSVCSVFM